jgi:hypothetical protein
MYSRLHNSRNQEIRRVELIMQDEGLGTLPTTIASVSSLLLFNSHVNVYKNYQKLDNLVSHGK